MRTVSCGRHPVLEQRKDSSVWAAAGTTWDELTVIIQVCIPCLTALLEMRRQSPGRREEWGKDIFKRYFILPIILLFVNNKFVAIPRCSLFCLWWYLVSHLCPYNNSWTFHYIFSAWCSCRGKWQSHFCGYLVSSQGQHTPLATFKYLYNKFWNSLFDCGKLNNFFFFFSLLFSW